MCVGVTPGGYVNRRNGWAPPKQAHHSYDRMVRETARFRSGPGVGSMRGREDKQMYSVEKHAAGANRYCDSGESSQRYLASVQRDRWSLPQQWSL